MCLRASLELIDVDAARETIKNQHCHYIAEVAFDLKKKLNDVLVVFQILHSE